MAFDPATAILNIGATLIDRLLPDPAAKQAATLQLMQLQQQGVLAQLAADTDLAKGQIGVDQAEAGNTNWFVSGWRPAVGWVCVLGLLYSFVLRPIAGGFAQKYLGVSMEALDMGTLGTLLFGMLGLGAARTVEKINGVASK